MARIDWLKKHLSLALAASTSTSALSLSLSLGSEDEWGSEKQRPTEADNLYTILTGYFTGTHFRICHPKSVDYCTVNDGTHTLHGILDPLVLPFLVRHDCAVRLFSLDRSVGLHSPLWRTIDSTIFAGSRRRQRSRLAQLRLQRWAPKRRQRPGNGAEGHRRTPRRSARAQVVSSAGCISMQPEPGRLLLSMVFRMHVPKATNAGTGRKALRPPHLRHTLARHGFLPAPLSVGIVVSVGALATAPPRQPSCSSSYGALYSRLLALLK